MIIFVINCGSSSIKYQLLDMRSDDVYDLLAKGIVEKIGLESGRLQHTPIGKDKVVKDMYIPDHTVGMQLVLDALVDKEYGVLNGIAYDGKYLWVTGKYWPQIYKIAVP